MRALQGGQSHAQPEGAFEVAPKLGRGVEQDHLREHSIGGPAEEAAEGTASRLPDEVRITAVQEKAIRQVAHGVAPYYEVIGFTLMDLRQDLRAASEAQGWTDLRRATGWTGCELWRRRRNRRRTRSPCCTLADLWETQGKPERRLALSGR